MMPLNLEHQLLDLSFQIFIIQVFPIDKDSVKLTIEGSLVC